MSIKIGIMGLGTVGGGVVKILQKQERHFTELLGQELVLKKVFSRSDRRLAELNLNKNLFTNNLEDFQKEDFDIVVETVGGDFPKDAMLKFLEKGTKIVTANKYLLATKPEEIFKNDSSKGIYFEASCCGSIPILSSLENGLLSNSISSLMGIFNGTCNYILSEMADKGSDFDSVLKDAQGLGYAEADPTFDVDGIDASHKLSLLSSLAFGKHVPFELIESEGIRPIKPQDFNWAKSNGYAIKLISMAEFNDKDGLSLGTFPALIKKSHPLSSVGGAYNAVYVKGDCAGDLMYYGAGAGEMPTASAIVNDILSAAQNNSQLRTQKAFNKLDPFQETNKNKEFEFYIRVKTPDKTGVLAKLSTAFADNGISLNFVHQTPADEQNANIVFMTHFVSNEVIKKAIKSVNIKDLLIAEPLVIRILEI